MHMNVDRNNNTVVRESDIKSNTTLNTQNTPQTLLGADFAEKIIETIETEYPTKEQLTLSLIKLLEICSPPEALEINKERLTNSLTEIFNTQTKSDEITEADLEETTESDDTTQQEEITEPDTITEVEPMELGIATASSKPKTEGKPPKVPNRERQTITEKIKTNSRGTPKYKIKK